MNLFLDTEYNGFGGELISMALVGDDGGEWYKVRLIPEVLSGWVAEHVIPVLGEPPVGDDEFRSSFHGFIRRYSGATIIADWSEDFVHFFSCLRGRDYGSSLNVSLSAFLCGQTDCHPAIPHNALSDARALRDWWKRK